MASPLTTSLAGDFPPGLAAQPDGKYLLAGAGGSGFGVVRFNADGSLAVSSPAFDFSGATVRYLGS